jgi:hypothetical protein
VRVAQIEAVDKALTTDRQVQPAGGDKGLVNCGHVGTFPPHFWHATPAFRPRQFDNIQSVRESKHALQRLAIMQSDGKKGSN